MPHGINNGSNGKETRVAWLLPSLKRGFYWQPVFREFARLFPESVVFTGLWPGFLPGFEKSFKVRPLRGLRFITLNRTPAGDAAGFYWTPMSIVPALVRFRPQIIFTVGFQLWSLFALLLRFLTGCRVILLWDGVSPAADFTNAPVRLRVRRLIARFLDASFSNTDEGARYLRDALFIPGSKVMRHPYEVPDLSLLDSRSATAYLPRDLHHPTFLFVGQLIERKGVDRLLRASALLKDQGMARFSVVVVGDGPEREALRKLANSLGLEQHVHCVGQVPYEKMGAYYRAADILVFPTLEDVWGLVVVEAMAFGKPVLCSKYAGSQEMVRNGENGFVFDPCQPEELAQMMARFIREPELIKNLGARSRQIIAPFTPEAAANILAKTIAHVLHQGPQPATLAENPSLRPSSH